MKTINDGATLAQQNGKGRVQALLEEKIQTDGVPQPGGIFVPVLDRTALAQQAGVGREYVSRLLTDMRLQGRIEPRGRGILFRDAPGINKQHDAALRDSVENPYPQEPINE